MRYNDPYVQLQRGFAEIDAALAQRVSQGEGVDVALVDTGVDTAHPDLKGRIRGIHDMVGDSVTPMYGDRHGTEVAGLIAAVGNNRLGLVGVAPEATLRVYKARSAERRVGTECVGQLRSRVLPYDSKTKSQVERR